MQVGAHVHNIKMFFKLEIAPGKTLERFVYLWLIYARQIYVVDSGVSGARDVIFSNVIETGHDPMNIATLFITHAHPDHIGGALGLQRATRCVVAAHEADKPWIEDTELQYQQRPVPSFYSIVEGPVRIERVLHDGDNLELRDGSALRIVHTPGHAKGHISLLYEADRALFCGDCIPLRGEMPIYEDAIASVKSIRRLKEIGGLDLLLSSWDMPRQGRQIYEMMDEALGYLQDIHRTVGKVKIELGAADLPMIARQVGRELGLPETALNPLFFKTVEAHLRVSDCRDLLAS